MSDPIGIPTIDISVRNVPKSECTDEQLTEMLIENIKVLHPDWSEAAHKHMAIQWMEHSERLTSKMNDDKRYYIYMERIN